jgi:hypothetical protein
MTEEETLARLQELCPNDPMGQCSQALFLKFKKDCHKIFIETGTGMGDGVSAALTAGFDTVYSIELNPELHEHCKERFQGDPRVKLILGNSLDELPKLLEEIPEPFFVFFDAHYSGGPYIGENMKTFLPKELASIESFSGKFKDSIIVVDDMSHWRGKDEGFVGLINELVAKLKPQGAPSYWEFPNGGCRLVSS